MLADAVSVWMGEGGFIASTGFTVSTAVSGAVTAGITALAGQAAVALINNQGDLAAALHDLGSSANVKNLLTAIVTGGVLGVMVVNVSIPRQNTSGLASATVIPIKRKFKKLL